MIPFLLFYISAISVGPQKAEWKGKIEYKNGVKVIKNPAEPLYGEIEFDLEEDLSIGSEEEDYSLSRVRGIAVDCQGNIYASDADKRKINKYDRNGRFLLTIGVDAQKNEVLEQPMKILLNEMTGFLYVLDRRHIKIFDKEGNYLTHISGRPQDFLLGDDECLFVKSHSRPPGLEEYKIFRMIDPQGKTLKEFAKICYMPTVGMFYEGILPGDDYTGIDYDLFITQMDHNALIYGYSKEYELNIIDSEGEPAYKIRKMEPYHKFPRTLRRSSKRLPPHKPFFHSLFTDGEGRIYVQINYNTHGLNGDKICDVFSKAGYYLYETVLPKGLKTIKEDCLYTSESIGDGKPFMQIKRYKIKNWDRIKTDL